MGKRTFMIIGVCICVGIVGMIVCLERRSSSTEYIFEEMDPETIEGKMIGSEPPRLLYADHNKVIFESGDIYVYDMMEKMLLKSFDVSSALSERYKECRCQSSVSSDGSEIMVVFSGLSGGFTAAYGYSFGTDKWEEMNEETYRNKKSGVFTCTLINADDKLAQITSGYAVYLSESEYFYLTFQEWKVSEIKIVYANGGTEVVYEVFEKSTIIN